MNLVYKRIRAASPGPSRPGVFLDRDGVLIQDTGYISHPDQVLHIPGSPEAIARLNRAGIPVALVTNQSGVGRGFYTWQDFEAVQAAIEARLAEFGGWLDGVWACGHHSEAPAEAQGDSVLADHPWRKPNPGMIHDAAAELGLDINRSWLAGDRTSDLEAGLRAGVRQVIQIAGAPLAPAERTANQESIVRCPDLATAVEYILANKDHL